MGTVLACTRQISACFSYFSSEVSLLKIVAGVFFVEDILYRHCQVSMLSATQSLTQLAMSYTISDKKLSLPKPGP